MSKWLKTGIGWHAQPLMLLVLMLLVLVLLVLVLLVFRALSPNGLRNILKKSSITGGIF